MNKRIPTQHQDRHKDEHKNAKYFTRFRRGDCYKLLLAARGLHNRRRAVSLHVLNITDGVRHIVLYAHVRHLQLHTLDYTITWQGNGTSSWSWYWYIYIYIPRFFIHCHASAGPLGRDRTISFPKAVVFRPETDFQEFSRAGKALTWSSLKQARVSHDSHMTILDPKSTKNVNLTWQS